MILRKLKNFAKVTHLSRAMTETEVPLHNPCTFLHIRMSPESP